MAINLIAEMACTYFMHECTELLRDSSSWFYCFSLAGFYGGIPANTPCQANFFWTRF